MMNETSSDASEERQQLERLMDAIELTFKGKREAVELTLIGMLAEGHVLFEDVPGVGKTTLVRALAASLGCVFRRVQFTSDLLPSDIVGISVFDKAQGDFVFKKGPVFANMVLADEINRTTPRTQSALLEAMNEAQVTVDNITHQLPQPFMVLATQNPLEFAGTYPLPESQMDRFLLRVSIGYPDAEVEQALIASLGAGDAPVVDPVMTAEDVARMQRLVRAVRATEETMGYLYQLVQATRTSPFVGLGVSTRGAIALFRAVQARAWLKGREHVLPDDLTALYRPVCAHRIVLRAHHDHAVERVTAAGNILDDILANTPVPV